MPAENGMNGMIRSTVLAMVGALGLVAGAQAEPAVQGTEAGPTAVGRFHTAMELAALGREREVTCH